MNRPQYILRACNYAISLGLQTQVMGIVNCTPDSFSGDGQLNKANTSSCLKYAYKLIREGADIIDVGGESTRPGALRVNPQEEIRRVIPVIEALARKVKVPVSVDTSKLEVACRALDAGASIVNNINGVGVGKSFLKMVRGYDAAIVLMHMRGTPKTMRLKAKYSDVVREVIEELKISVEKCLEIGIKKDRIMVDPGIGFAKTIDHNLALINSLDQLSVFHCPILLGTSRKSFIGEILKNDVGQRLMGTAASVVVGVMRGAHIVRVHDVKPVKQTLKITDAILNAHP